MTIYINDGCVYDCEVLEQLQFSKIIKYGGITKEVWKQSVFNLPEEKEKALFFLEETEDFCRMWKKKLGVMK